MTGARLPSMPLMMPEPTAHCIAEAAQLLTLAASLEARSEHPLAKAVLREAEARGVKTSAVTDFAALPGNGLTASLDGKPLELTAKEFDLLALLIQNKGKAMKKDYLFNTVWGSDSDSELQTLHVHINRLRQKLGDDPKNAKRLLTVWGVGYKFV